ncbi:MAG: hypothetical protein GXO39_05545 [Thermotogae bacterium]|nr:hypothetical protein [Thermotogota bacterium]
MALLLILSQKFYENFLQGSKRGYYWYFRSRNAWAALEYRDTPPYMIERLLIILDHPIYSSYFVKPDSLFVVGDTACYLYRVSKNRALLDKILGECNPNSWIFAKNWKLHIVVPKKREVTVYNIENAEMHFAALERYDHDIVNCWMARDLVCALDTGVFRGAKMVYPLDLSGKKFVVLYRWGIRLLNGGDTILELKTPSIPLSVTYSHGLIHIALGTHGILTVDAERGAYTYLKNLPTVDIYASRYYFKVFAEDMDGCLHVLKPVFRPPSLRYLTKADISFCKTGVK